MLFLTFEANSADCSFPKLHIFRILAHCALLWLGSKTFRPLDLTCPGDIMISATTLMAMLVSKMASLFSRSQKCLRSILILHILLGAVLCPACPALVHHIMAGLNKPVFPPPLVSDPPNNVMKFSVDKIVKILNKLKTLFLKSSNISS